MTEDRIELVDRDYGQSIRVNPSRQIKTRSTSFGNIRERYNRFRLKYLERKLEKKIESALTQGYTEENYERKITKNANIIAKIEEKIMLLSKENVPEDYVAKRAIKLRKNMISNLTYNCGVMYTVGLENRDAVFGREEVEEIVEPEVQPAKPTKEDLSAVKEENRRNVSIPVNDAMLAAAIPADTSSDEIDVVPSDLERQAIVDVVNSSFDDIKENENGETITTDEVKEVVEDALDKVEGPKEDAPQTTDGASEVDRETVRGIIEEAFEAMEKGEKAPTDQVVVNGPVPKLNRPTVDGVVVNGPVPKLNRPTVDGVVVNGPVPKLNRPTVDGVVVNGPVPKLNRPTVDGVVVNGPVPKLNRPSTDQVVVNGPVPKLNKVVVNGPVPILRSAHVVETPVTVSQYEKDALHEEVEREIEKIRVSRNNSTAANVSQYDENGYRRERRKKYNYTPMTDEEIRASQIKLGFDEHGNLIDNGARPKETISSAKVVGSFIAPGSIPDISLDDVFVPADKQVRDMPVVVPDRDDSSFGLDLDDGKSMFELIDPPEKKEEPVVPTATALEGATVADYNELKKKLLFLQQQKQLTQQQKVEAQRAAQEAAEQAQEARRLYEVSQASYNERMEKLRAYTASLEADCSENVRSTEQAEDEARRSHSFAQEQRELADNNNSIIGEIDSMIGSSETTASRVR